MSVFSDLRSSRIQCFMGMLLTPRRGISTTPKNYRSVNAVEVIYCIILLGFIIYTLITSNRLFIFGVIYIMVEMTQLFYRKRLISEYWRSKPSIKKEKELLDSLVTLIEFKAICNIIIIFALLDALGVIS